MGAIIKPQSNKLGTLVLVLIFVACATGAIKLGSRVSETVALRSVYGSERVAREHLQIVRTKPYPIVSNGDQLKAWGLRMFLIMLAFFIGGTAISMVATFRLLPAPLRHAAEHHKQMEADMGWWPLIVFFPMAVYMMTTRSLVPNAITLVLAVALAWIGPRMPDYRSA